jgi:regulator of protease activity HflC (stomatin/prohibitin superfamily)
MLSANEVAKPSCFGYSCRLEMFEADMLELVLVLTVLVLFYLLLAVKIVPQSQNWLVERLGKFNRKLEAGLHIIIPIFERISHKVDILERQLPPRKIPTITLDNVTIEVSLAILYRIVDASKSEYRVRNIDQAIETTVIGTVRSVIGKTDLDGVQSNRRHLADAIETELQQVSEEWGIVLTRVEIIDVEVDSETKQAMQLQLNAERTRRAIVREAEGKKEAAQLAADAELYSAQKQAEAKRILAEAEAYSVAVISKAIADGGTPAIDFEVKRIQAEAVRSLTSSNNSKVIFVPSDVLDGLRSVTAKISERL